MTKKFLLVFILMLPSTGLAIPNWSPEEQLTNSSAWAYNGDEAVGPEGTLHMLSCDNRTGLPIIYYQRKADGEQSWSSPAVLSSEAGSVQAGLSAIYADPEEENNIYAVWEEYFGGEVRIYFRHSQDAGLTCSDSVLVAGEAAGTSQAGHPDLVVDSGHTMHLVWQDGLTNQVMYRQGPADGLTLSTPMILSGSDASHPGIARGSSKLVVFWQEPVAGFEQIKYKESGNGGGDWSNPRILGTAPSSHCMEPSLVFDGQDNFYAVWSRDNAIVFQKADASLGVLPPLIVSTSTGGSCLQPAIVVKDSKIAVAWVYNDAGHWQIRVNASSDGGSTWGEDAGFESGASVSRPRLAEDRGNIHLFYDFDLSGGGQEQVWHALRDDTGPPAPQISSVSHPDQEQSGNNWPIFTWPREDNPGGIGVQGYVVAFDNQPDSDPGDIITQAAQENSAEFFGLENGTYYLHIKAVDSLNNLGSVAHYAINIDRNSFFPGDQVWVAPSPVRDGELNLRFFLSRVAEIKLEFFDAAGRKLGSQALAGEMGINQLCRDIHDWVNGTFFYRLTARAHDNGQEAVVTKPFVVLR